MIAAGTSCSSAPQGSLQCLREGKMLSERPLATATNVSLVPFESLNSSIVAFYGQFYFSPIAYGDFLRNLPTFAFEHGLMAPVDIITGCTTDGGMSPALSGQISLNTTDQVSSLIQYVAGIPAALTAEWLNYYPLNSSYQPYSEPMMLARLVGPCCNCWRTIRCPNLPRLRHCD